MGFGNKIKKLKTLLGNTEKIRTSFNQIIFDEKINNILGKYNLISLKPVLPVEFFKRINNYDINSEISIFTDFMNGSSPIIDYWFLCHAARALKIKNYFEIGTWVGLSAYNISKNTGPDAKIYTLDIPFDHPDLKEYGIPETLFGFHSANIKNITHLKCDSKIFDFSPYKEKIDLIFIDGNHSLDYVINDTIKAFDCLKHEGSVIFWHDYILGGNINNNVLGGILEAVPESEHKYLYYLYQSNMAVYCRFLGDVKHDIGKWELPELKFNILINPK